MTESPDEFEAGAPRKVGPTQLLDSGVEIRRLPKLRVSLSLADGETKVLELAQDEILVGSEPGLDIVIDDGSVSRHHLAIRLREDGWLLCDLGSTNGTFIGEMRVERVQLSAKATVRLGRVLVDLQPLSEHVDREISTSDRFGRMLGQSAIMREMFAVLQQVAPSGLTVLVEGETGTGKELAAAAIHENSGREGAFVVLNCGAIPTELIESEIMGHVKGAFTGATENRDGAFVVADGGTLFLDEIGELPLDMQAKLLRVLEQGEVKAVGSDGHRVVDVRVVAATNRRLEAEVEQKRFREDLYYRLAVVVVRIPPLRARREDLAALVSHIHGELNRRSLVVRGRAIPPLDAAAMGMLERYDFPGNVRELRNIIERWSVLGPNSPPGQASVRSGITEPGAEPGGEIVDEALLQLPYHEAKEAWIERFERSYLQRALEASGGNVSQAAREAGVDRRHLQRLMVRHGVTRGTGLAED